MREPGPAHRIMGLGDDGANDPTGSLLQTIRQLISQDIQAHALPGTISSRVKGFLLSSPGLRENTRNLLQGRPVELPGDPARGDPLTTGLDRVILAALPREGPHGFLEHGLDPPAVSVSLVVELPAGSVLFVAMTRPFLERTMAGPVWLNILAQVAIREFMIRVEGLSPLEARIEESLYNSFHTTGSVVSDLIRDSLLCCADRGEFERLEEIAGSLEALTAQLREIPADRLGPGGLARAQELARGVSQEAGCLARLSRIEDYASGKPLMIRPADIIAEKVRTELSIAEMPCLYLPPYLAGSLGERVAGITHQGSPPQVRVIRDVIAYKSPPMTGEGTPLADSVRHWVELYLEFCERNIEGLELLQSGIMGLADIHEARSIIDAMIEIHGKLAAGAGRSYHELLEATIEGSAGSETLGLALNRLINTIHQDVLKNVFGVFKGWKNVIGEVNTISSKAVCVTIDAQGGMEFYPANKVNIIDYSGDFRSPRAVPARTIMESYLSTNVHLRDNCYIDCISHTNKAWFFVDLGLHGANIFVDLDPNKPMITASYAEGNVEDGNMARMRVLMETMIELGFQVSKTEITLAARLDEKTSGTLDAGELIDKAVWTIQAFASVADFDQEIEDGRITERSLAFHRQRLAASGTGFPLYIVTRGAMELKKLSETLARINAAAIPLLNSELSRLGLEPIPEGDASSKAVEMAFNRPIARGIAAGEFLSLAGDPLFRNPGYERPDPLVYLAGLLPEACLTETAAIVNTLDKVVGSVSLKTSGQDALTRSCIHLSGESLSLYALRDHDSYKPIRAFAVDGPSLSKVHESDNIIRDPASLKSLLEKHGYHLETIEKRLQWSSPMGMPIRGITAGAITSCPGIATGFLRKNRPESMPDDFRSSIFSDTLLTPEEVGRLQEAAGYITTRDSTLSHAQLTARTFGKPGVILQAAQWCGDGHGARLVLSFGNQQSRAVQEGTVVTVDGFRGRVVLPGASPSPEEDFSEVIRETFSLLVSIEAADHPEEMLAQLRALIARAGNIDVLAFIIQELFISRTLKDSAHKLAILKCIGEAGRAAFITPMKDHMRDIILESRRRQRSDIELARRRITKAADPDEAFFVSTRLHTRLRRAVEMENMVCPRVGLTVLDYSHDLEEIRALLAMKRTEFTAQALRKIEPFVADPASLGDPEVEMVLRTIEGASLPLAGSTGTDGPLFGHLLRLEPLVKDRLKRFAESKDSRVVDLGTAGRITAGFVGNKAASLGELERGLPGLAIPPGFILTTLGIQELVLENRQLAEEVNAVLHAHAFDHASCFREILPLVSAFTFPPKTEQKITTLYHGLERAMSGQDKTAEIERLLALCGIDGKLPAGDRDTGGLLGDLTIGEAILRLGIPEPLLSPLRSRYESEGGGFVVVRSSSIHEDTRTDMMAGRFMSYPYVRGKEFLLTSALKCLAYSWVETGGITESQPVLIHLQVESDVAMVVNSINLSEHRWDEVIVNAAWGAGSGLVSSQVESDLYVLDAASFTVKHTIQNTKKTRTVFDREAGHGTTTAMIADRSEQRRKTLNEEDAARVARLARRIHDFYGYPVDIEAVMRQGVIHVVQVRPLAFPLSPD